MEWFISYCYHAPSESEHRIIELTVDADTKEEADQKFEELRKEASVMYPGYFCSEASQLSSLTAD